MSVYKVSVTRDDKWWMITVPDLARHVTADGTINVSDTTQARRLADVSKGARDFICTVTDSAPSEVEVELTVTVDEIDVSARADKVLEDRRLAEKYATNAQDGARELARGLATKGIPVRDIGEVLGVSFQRAQQLIA